MVVQRDERATLLNIPDLDDSNPSANNSDRDGETTGTQYCMLALDFKQICMFLNTEKELFLS